MLVYADAAATTRMSQAAFEIMQPYYRDFYGNPSSSHFVGQKAAEALQYAREQIARCIHAEPEEIYFTSGGTEADNWAVYMGFDVIFNTTRKEMRASAIEHHALLNKLPLTSKKIPVTEDGIVDVRDVDLAIGTTTGFVSIMLANNEIGTIQPIQEIAKTCAERNVLFHTDAVQAVGHIPVDVKALGVDMLSASAHKFHGTKGVGFLYVRDGIGMESMIKGGGQERGYRSGTENLPGIVGMAAALEEATSQMSVTIPRVTAMRERLIEGLAKIPGSILNGDRERRLPGIVNFCFDGVDGETLVVLLSERGIMASSGSACMTGSREPSHVLMSIGRDEEMAKSALRLSIDDTNTDEEIEYILKTVPSCVEYLRSISPRG